MKQLVLACLVLLLCSYSYARTSVQGVFDEYAYPLGCGTMDDNMTPVAPGMTPRDWEIASMDSRLATIVTDTAANAITIHVGDEDEYWVSLGSGGFTANPVMRPKPSRAVAMEIALSIAAKHGLKVVFLIEFSQQRRTIASGPNQGDNFGTLGGNAGLYAYINAIMHPRAYYTNPTETCTTGLTKIGLADHCIEPYGPYYQDSRVAGWIFSAEMSSDYARDALLCKLAPAASRAYCIH
jgi:hypothetical protein